jgi:hypothetical protein
VVLKKCPSEIVRFDLDGALTYIESSNSSTVWGSVLGKAEYTFLPLVLSRNHESRFLENPNTRYFSNLELCSVWWLYAISKTTANEVHHFLKKHAYSSRHNLLVTSCDPGSNASFSMVAGSWLAFYFPILTTHCKILNKRRLLMYFEWVLATEVFETYFFHQSNSSE